MNSNLSQVLAWIDEDEGPEVNINASEPGGGSSHGLTIEVWNEYNKANGLPAKAISDLGSVTAALVGPIFSWRYLDPVRFDDLPSGIDYRMADAAITLGETGACLLIQMALTLYPTTGIMDEATLNAVKAADPKVLLPSLDAAWLAWKHGLTATGWANFGHGWINRVKKVRARYEAMI